MSEFFEGIYYKHQNQGETVCIIPGHTKREAFIHVITNEGSSQYSFSSLEQSGCRFGPAGITMVLPQVRGEVHYANLTPLRYDIMGPFRYLPLECKHQVVSMRHDLDGTLEVNGKLIDLSGGIGYIEGDHGRSFPKRYLWLHCNEFTEPCSIMVSVAHIPFWVADFMGCIGVVWYRGKEYRFGTYLGVRIRRATPSKVVLEQGKLRLEITVAPETAHPLASPKVGVMSDTIYESNQTLAHFRLYEREELVLDLTSHNTSYECEGISLF